MLMAKTPETETVSTGLSTSTAVLIGSVLISLSLLLSSGIIRIKGMTPTRSITANTAADPAPTGQTVPTVDAGPFNEKVAALATSAGLDGNKLKNCFDNNKYQAEIDKDISDAGAAGASGTPSFFIGKSDPSGTINGSQVTGAYPYSRFKEVIDAVLAGTPVPKETGATAEVTVAKVSIDDDPVLGNANAPITMIEFSDYECPFCKRHFDQTYGQIKKDYIDTGKLKLVYRDFIAVPAHNPAATQAALAANCAREQGGDSAYYKFHDAYYKATQSNGQSI
jgi:protein-disulfide isomerase